MALVDIIRFEVAASRSASFAVVGLDSSGRAAAIVLAG